MNYSLTGQSGSIQFSTSSFLVEKGSVLHSGIYNRELTSSMAAGASLVLAGLLFVDSITINALFWVSLLAAFAALFIGFRYLVFRDPVLILKIDISSGVATIIKRASIFSKTQSFPIDEIAGFKKDYSVSMPENPDGVKVVEGIALQHFTVIPGFGQPSEFHTVKLLRSNGEEFVIYGSKDEAMAHEVLKAIQEGFSFVASKRDLLLQKGSLGDKP